MQLIVGAGGRLGGSFKVPGDKSISHRAVMFGSFAEGPTEIRDCLMGEDVIATINAFRALGVRVDTTEPDRIIVRGAGPEAFRAPRAALDLGNSGTSMRLLAGLLAGVGLPIEMRGDSSLCARPMRRVTEPLALMGARIDTSADGTPPLIIHPVGQLRSIHYELPVASAQVKSAILLAGLSASGRTSVVETTPSRDHTERLLGAFGVAVASAGGTVSVEGGQRLSGTVVTVPGDISSAAFFFVGAAMVDGSEVTVRRVGVNPTRDGIIELLKLMGADIELRNRSTIGAEPVADVTVRGRGLRGIDIPARLVPSAIDEFPALFVAAAVADGVTRLAQAAELRLKESDRIDAMAGGLRELGIEVETREDGIVINGSAGGFSGGHIDSRGDHRIAMAFAMAALRSRGAITLDNCAAISTSFPGFVDLARGAGLRVAQTG